MHKSKVFRKFKILHLKYLRGFQSSGILSSNFNPKATLDHLKKVYSVVNRFADLKHHVEQNDMGDVFTIPSSFELDSTTGHYVPSSNATSIDLFTDANLVTLETVRHANAYFARYGASYHGENILLFVRGILL